MMYAAAKSFSVLEHEGAPGFNVTHATIESVVGPLKGTVVLLENEGRKSCLICLHMLSHTRFLYRKFQETVSQAIGVQPRDVFVFSSHNHSSAKLTDEPANAFWGEGKSTGV